MSGSSCQGRGADERQGSSCSGSEAVPEKVALTGPECWSRPEQAHATPPPKQAEGALGRWYLIGRIKEGEGPWPSWEEGRPE